MPIRNCLNHKSVPATVQCFQCHKPVCDECRCTTALGDFCSDACAGKYAEFKASYREARLHQPSLVLRLVKLAVALAVLLGVVHAAHRFLGIDALASFDILGKILGG
ncbi:MAG: hypothetical protein ABIH26_07715 [Candidatus Eisenbacteria bacterium]